MASDIALPDGMMAIVIQCGHSRPGEKITFATRCMK